MLENQIQILDDYENLYIVWRAERTSAIRNDAAIVSEMSFDTSR